MWGKGSLSLTPFYFEQQVPGDANFIKLSGLDMDHEYEFHINIKTTAGQYESNRTIARTHKMDNLTGIRVAFGNFENPEPTLTEMKQLLESMGATWTDEVNHETTHLLAQLPGSRNYDTAVRYSIPVVKPDWLVQCDRNKKIQVKLEPHTHTRNNSIGTYPSFCSHQPALPYYIVSVPSNDQ
jgi:hypothetical protein